nr:hypothetical protein [Hypnea sp.]
MNLFVGTCRIISNPRLYCKNKKILMRTVVSLYSKKKKTYLHPVLVKAKGKIARVIFDFYKKADFVIIEGSMKVKFHKIHLAKTKNIKVITLQVKRINHIIKN